jgi:ribose 1,5-bisphosphokinase
MPIGPGRLVLVVGPSGAGKDTLILAARRNLQGDATVMFPRRVVTRPASSFEDHDSLSEADFARALLAGGFALSWEAHGLRYGVPAIVDAQIVGGLTVVANVSRTVLAPARARYANVTVALITAPAEILASRLAARARATDGAIAQRLARVPDRDGDVAADVVIENIGAPETGAARLIAAIRGDRDSVPRTSERSERGSAV